MRRSTLPDSSRHRAGFTMLEMITAVAVSTIVVGGLFSLFNLQSKQFLYQDTQMNMHQNLRFAADIITRTVRLAGNGSMGATRGVLGWDGSSTDADNSMPVVISWDGGTTGTDAITVVYADPTLEMHSSVLSVEPCTTSTLTFDMDMLNYSNLIGNLTTGELLMCWDHAAIAGTRSWIWEIDGGGDASTGQVSVIDNSSYTDFSNDCSSTENLPPIVTCSRGNVVTFYIDDDSTDGSGPGSEDHPVLMMDLDYDYPATGGSEDDIPLVDDIEDLQIAYCRDNDDCTDDTVWVDDLSAAAGEGETVWMARINLIARTPRLDPRDQHSEVRPGMENRAATSTSDRYYREILTTQVTIRNLRYMAN